MMYIFKGKGAIHLIFTDIILTIMADKTQENLDYNPTKTTWIIL